MTFNDSFGSWLKRRRQALDLTQKDLAGQVCCAPVTIRKVEGNAIRPSRQMAERLADALAISAEERAAFLAFARGAKNDLPAVPGETASLTPAHNLPMQSTLFVGRERELAQIQERLANPACRLLALVGPGGIGKTRLALQASAGQLADYTHGVYFVPLAPINSSSFIASAIAAALKFTFVGPQDTGVQIIDYLREKQMLLVLDNLEQLLEGTAFLTDLLAQAPKVKILATTRERLNMQEEWVLAVGGLPFPDEPGDKSDINSYDAVQLFVQRAQQIQADFSLARDTAAVVTVCRMVEGMPLWLKECH